MRRGEGEGADPRGVGDGKYIRKLKNYAVNRKCNSYQKHDIVPLMAVYSK